MKKKGIIFSAIFFFMIGIFSFAGCGREESTTYSTPEGKVTVTARQEGRKEVVKLETKEGTLTVSAGPHAVSEAQLGVPIYPGAQIVSSGQLDHVKGSSSGIASSFLMTTDDNFDKVVAFYKANLKDIQQAMDQTMGNQRMAMFMSGKQGDMKNIQITGAPKGGPTNIQITKISER